MKEIKNNRNKWLHVRLSEQEYLAIQKMFAETTERKLSDYIRKIIFQKPIIKAYRNQSMDDFVAVMMQLKTELNSIGKNFNQVVKRLHVFPSSEPILSILKEYENDKIKLFQQIEIIQIFIEKNAAKW